MRQSPSSASAARAWHRLALLVLAAGSSTRMGSPKALVDLDGRNLLEHLLAPRLLREFGEVLVVLGHHAAALKPVVDRCGYRSVLNPEPDRGRTSSVQVGLAALGSHLEGVFVQPVDCPLILPSTYAALAQARCSAEVVIPAYQGSHGHPPLFSATLAPRLLAAPAEVPLRDLLRGPDVRRQLVPVDDPGVLLNIDRPEDLPRLIEIYTSRSGSPNDQHS